MGGRLVLLSALACGGAGTEDGTVDTTSSEASESSETGDEAPDLSEAGPFVAGHLRFELPDPDGARELPVEVWYPSAAPASAPRSTITDFIDPERWGPTQTQAFADLVAAADPACTTSSTDAVSSAAFADANEVGERLPLVLVSHCHVCTRFSTFSVAERLASHGFVVAAVDHVDNTLLDELEGDAVGVEAAFLEVRGADIRRLLDAMLSDADPLPIELRGRIDAQRVGMYGHSFGAATTGWVLQREPRISAGAALAAPVESPLLPGVDLAAIDQPLLYLLATEDNSITEIGNNLIRANFADHPSAAWLVEIIDAGHWSFTNICGIIDGFSPGCGEGERQTSPGTAFSYLDNDVARDITADYVTAFFALQLRGEAEAEAMLNTPHASGATSVDAHD